MAKFGKSRSNDENRDARHLCRNNNLSYEQSCQKQLLMKQIVDSLKDMVHDIGLTHYSASSYASMTRPGHIGRLSVRDQC